MAVTIVGRQQSFRGLRPLNPSRDLRQVTELIAETFGALLDAEGRAALREMRQLSRLGPLVNWLLSADPQLRRFLNGYVWIEEGRVVGNLTLQTSLRRGARWYISNVAVAPAYRGRGIGHALVAAALEEIRRDGGGWATLQVDADNEAARRLYEGFGFEALSGLTYLRLAESPAERSAAILPPELRRWQPDDWQREYQLARLATPSLLQWWQPVRSAAFRSYPEDQIGEWFARLFGRQHVHRWVVESGSDGQRGLDASLLVRGSRWRGEHQIRLLVHPDARGSLEAPLVQHALNTLSRFPTRPTTTRHPSQHSAAIDAFTQQGFGVRRTLLAMRKRIR